VSWPMVSMSEAVKVGGGFAFKSKDFDEDGYPIIRISNINNGVVDLSKAARIPSEKIGKGLAYTVESGDILMAMSGATTGKVGVFYSDQPETVYLNQRVGKFVSNSKLLNEKYLWFFLRSPNCQDQINLLAEGAAQPNISGPQLESIKIPLPPLETQKQIASVLEKADQLRKDCKQMEQELNSLAQSVFIDMFGRSARGYNDWPLYKIESLAVEKKSSMRTGPFGSDLKHSEFVESGIAVIGIDNAVKNEFAWGKRRFITKEKYEKLKRYRVYPDDLIITIMGTTGRIAVVPNDIPLAISTKHLAVITLDKEKALPEFLSVALKTHPDLLSQIRDSNKGAIMDGLNLGLIKSLKLHLPPIELQEEYIDKFNVIHSQIDKVCKVVSENEELFNSLMQKAFKGELSLKSTKKVA
jgi:type I restriction enzyme S subunit